jgi:hypothetical protein
MSISRPSSLLTLALFASAPTVAYAQAPSAGDIAQARELLNAGETLRDHGDLPHALEKLQAADALLHTPITALELARTYAQAGKLVEARETFLGVARIPVSREETSRSKAARAQSEKLADEIGPKIPVLNIRVTGVALDTVAIAIDGAAVPTGAVAAPRMVNPGSHVVRATSTAGGEAETTISLKEGETRDVELKIVFTGGSLATPVAPSSSTRSEPGTASTSDSRAADRAPRSRVLEWSLLGGGAAIGVAGAVLMGVEANKAGDAVSALDRSAYNSATTGWRVGLAGTILGAAAVAGGGVLFVTSREGAATTSSRSRLWFAVGGSDLRIGGTW